MLPMCPDRTAKMSIKPMQPDGRFAAAADRHGVDNRGMTTRKYISEFGLVSVAGYRRLLQQEHLDRVADAGIQPHIYFIGRRPRIMLEAESVKFGSEEVTGVFLIQRGMRTERFPFVGRNFLGTTDVKLECPYPHTEYAIRDSNGVVISNGKVALLMATISSKFWPHLDLEVLYIGQAYGAEGERTAGIRLASHSTLQHIYAEAIRKSPDHEIWLLLCSFDMQLLASFDGISKNIKSTLARDTSHIDKVVSSPITEQQQINFTEAALIRYFQPEYNVIYKDSFPSPAHATYAQCYELDLNTLIAEINTEELMLRIWSHAVKPKWTHFAQFALHDAEERKAMFDLL